MQRRREVSRLWGSFGFRSKRLSSPAPPMRHASRHAARSEGIVLQSLPRVESFGGRKRAWPRSGCRLPDRGHWCLHPRIVKSRGPAELFGAWRDSPPPRAEVLRHRVCALRVLIEGKVGAFLPPRIVGSDFDAAYPVRTRGRRVLSTCHFSRIPLVAHPILISLVFFFFFFNSFFVIEPEFTGLIIYHFHSIYFPFSPFYLSCS